VERPSELVKTLRVRPFSVPISTLAPVSLADTLARITIIATKVMTVCCSNLCYNLLPIGIVISHMAPTNSAVISGDNGWSLRVNRQAHAGAKKRGAE
jgi:hypothetical protein